MKRTTTWLTGLSAAVMAVALAVPTVSAQQQKAPVAPAAKAPAAKAPASATKPAKTAKRPASHCKGLADVQCKATAGCTWRAERTVKKGERKGKKIAAHCRLDTPPPKNKAKAAAGAPAAKAAAPAVKAPAKKATPPPSSAGPAPKN